MKKRLFVVLLTLGLAVPARAMVNVNTATQSELEAVKGIGPAKAKAIIEYRQQHGPFSSIDDLAKVKGLGKKSVRKLKNVLTVDGKQVEVKPRVSNRN